MINQGISPQEPRSRNLQRLALLSIILDILVVGTSAFLALTQSLAYMIGGVGFLVAGVLSVMALLLSRRGNPTRGGWYLSFGFMLAYLLSAAELPGLGSLIGIAGLVTVLFIVVQCMPPEELRRGLIAGALTSLIASLFSITSLFPQIIPASSTVITTLGWVARIAILGYIVLILSQYRTLNLNSKFITIFVSITVVVIIIITSVLEISTTNALSAQIGRELNNTAKARGNALGEYVGAQIDDMQILSLNTALQKALGEANTAYTGNSAQNLAGISRIDNQWKADISNHVTSPEMNRRLNNSTARDLTKFQNLFPNHVEVFVTDVNGALVATTNLTSDYYQADESWWQAAYKNGQGSSYISSPEYDESSATLSLLLAVPVYDTRTKSIIGILRSTLSLNSIADVISEPLGATGNADVIFPESGQYFHAGILDAIPLEFQATLDQISGKLYGQASYQGIESLLAAAPVQTISESNAINTLGWSVVAHQSRIEALTPVQKQTGGIGFFGTLMIGIIALLSLVVAQTLARPILDLTRVANEITAGNLNARAPIETHDEIGMLAQSFNGMTSQLQETLAGLEKRVEERTHALERRAAQIQTAADVGSVATSLRDLDELFKQVTKLISQRFGYYHVGIFMIDDQGEYAILRGSNSEGGQHMLERGHSLRVGQVGIVGYVARSGLPRIALDVGQDAVFFENPDLPKTRSEMCLPLVFGGKIIGALDVQSIQESAFADEDTATLKVLADQLAIAIDNARLLAEGRLAMEAAQRAYGTVSRAGWQSLMREQGETFGFISTSEKDVAPVGQEISLEFLQALESKKPALSSDGRTLHVPVLIRGETIGAIRLDKPEDSSKWTPDDITAAGTLADQLGTSLESARLFNDTSRRAERERILGEISAQISTSMRMDTILETAVGEIGRIFNDTEVVLQLRNPATEEKEPDK